jgi:ubiquinone/menaquinone biosynthesis C-methylase UbiE/DNA-binding HxlR family transcriptional regulator
MTEALDIFKALSDEVRLRIVHALLAGELSVAELVDVLGLPQSTVSRHLKPLRDTRLVETRREGTSVYYRRGPQLADGVLGHVLQERLQGLPTSADDAKAVRRVIDQRRQRSKEFFEKVAGKYSGLTQPGGGWPALAAALAAGFAGKDVADLGSGEGLLTILLARFARSVTAVDLAPRMLNEVRHAAKEAGVADRVKTAEGDLEALPLKTGSLDAVFLSQALHHAARPPVAVAEAARVLRKGGQLVVLDLVKHEEEGLREKMADQWMGFEAADVVEWMERAGLSEPVVAELDGASEMKILLVVGMRSGQRSTFNAQHSTSKGASEEK